MNSATLRLGTRRSPMALAQSGHVAALITERTGWQVEIVGVTTLGDVSRAQLTQIGGTGVFVSALRESLLLGGRRPCATHAPRRSPRRSSAATRSCTGGFPKTSSTSTPKGIQQSNEVSRFGVLDLINEGLDSVRGDRLVEFR